MHAALFVWLCGLFLISLIYLGMLPDFFLKNRTESYERKMQHWIIINGKWCFEWGLYELVKMEKYETLSGTKLDKKSIIHGHQTLLQKSYNSLLQHREWWKFHSPFSKEKTKKVFLVIFDSALILCCMQNKYLDKELT